MKLIWFDYCGLAVSAIILVSFYTRNSIPILQNKIFISQVWVALATTSLNLLLGIWQNNGFATAGPQYLLLAEIAAFLYHILRMVNALLYVYYIVIVLDIEENSRFMRLCIYLPFAAAMATCVLGFVTKQLIYFDEQGHHQVGPLMSILYAIAFFYLFVIIYLTVYYRNVIPLPRRIAFHSFGTLVLGTVIVERCFPNIMIEGFGSVLCQLLIYLTIQRPEEIVNGSTGLLNKLSFLRMLAVQLRQKKHFDLIIITVKNRRFLEKSLGMRAWSVLMFEVANYLRRLTKRVRAYQLSDGTYCLIIPHTFPGEPMTEQILNNLKERAVLPWKIMELSIHLPTDFLLCHCPEDAASAQDILDLIERADMHSQNIDSEHTSSEMRTRIREVERAIDDAIREGSFEVVYQPIYSTAQRRFQSAEALLRLTDRQLGTVPPDEFIPIAEKSGAIIAIGQYVLEQTCRFIQEHQLILKGIEYIEVNLSVVECLQDDLVERILNTLNRYGIEANQINFEITETASDSLPEPIVNNIWRLADSGIRFSLDDYGSGYSNIGRILKIPLDIVKLDKSIFEAYFNHESRDADIIIKETIQMLKKLNKGIVAEGIETEEQAACLIDLGCDYIQGYYYSKPLSQTAFLKLLNA